MPKPRPAVGPEYGFGLYIHWPYCARICPYCDFNVYAAKDRDPGALLEAMCRDIFDNAARLPSHPPLNSIFFGGGTPSLLPAGSIGRLIESAEQAFGLVEGAEISLEANPNDVLRSTPSDWQQAGINRLSLGVQSLDDDALRFLGRDHDAQAARTAYKSATQQFDNVSLDLIYALPDQTLAAWEGQLQAALRLGAPHLSLYELTIEPPTPFGKQVERGEWSPMNDDRQADLYELTQTLCHEAGLPAYEVSNHARSAAYESVHNRIYWRSGDWLGIGPGAHGRITHNGERFATEAVRRPQAYSDGEPAQETALNELDQARELVAMALRYREGLDLGRLVALGQYRPDDQILSDLAQTGLINVDGDIVALTEAGRLVADYVATQLSP